MNHISQRLQKVKDIVGDVLFPVFCVGCNTEGVLLCVHCQNSIAIQGVWCCPVCHRETDGGYTCSDCIRHSFLVRHIAMAPYSTPSTIGTLLHLLKYRFVEQVVPSLGPLISRFIGNNIQAFTSIDYIIPVPLHPRRQAERGFNQSELIAKEVSRLLHVPVLRCVRRQRYTRQQSTLTKEERKENIHQAFALVDTLPEGRFLLVDDIFTTGSTLQACAEIVRPGGEVLSFTIARG